jgi:regulatory Fis family protein
VTSGKWAKALRTTEEGSAHAFSLTSSESERFVMIKNGKHLHGIYSVVPDERGRDLWVEIGYATRHADGRGFDLTLRALPLERKLVLREPSLEAPVTESKEASQDTNALSLAYQVREFERAAISQCLLETGGNIGAALQRLQIPRRTLNEKMARLGIDRRRLTPPLQLNKASNLERAQQSSQNPNGEPGASFGQPPWGRQGASDGHELD